MKTIYFETCIINSLSKCIYGNRSYCSACRSCYHSSSRGVVVINHGPDMTFTGNINFDVESQTNNNLQVGSTVIPNVVYGAAFNKTGAPDTIIPAQTYVCRYKKMGPECVHRG